MAVKNNVQAITASAVASTALTGSYQLLGKLSNACFLVRIINNSDEDVSVSYDGTNQHDFVPKGTQLQVNAQTNAQPNTLIANFAANLPVYIKGSAGMSGSIYLAGYYQPQAASK